MIAVPSAEIGEKLALAFEKDLGELSGPFYATIERGKTSLNDLDRFARIGPSGFKKTGGERKLYEDILFHFQASLPAYFLGRCIGATPICSSAVYGAP